eukprot:TRINITY_DN45011_c0_g2_i1.p1 TRINITY_DN45011_c0_g2~~TRINITY_DN45011_c0_g2_i1.p1  ORF type:complete len:356 (+),score=21.54 TRINITY_DN45011_c0_g2_i1:52-1119(+)
MTNVFICCKSITSILSAQNTSFLFVKCTSCTRLVDKPETLQLQGKAEKLRRAAQQSVGLPSMPRHTMLHICSFVGVPTHLTSTSSVIARAHGRCSPFAAMMPLTQIAVYRFLDPCSAFGVSLVHRHWTDILRPQDVRELAENYMISQTEPSSTCESHAKGSVTTIRRLLQQRDETACLAYSATLQYDAVFSTMAGFALFCSLSKTDPTSQQDEKLHGPEGHDRFLDIWEKIVHLYSMHGTTQHSAHYKFPERRRTARRHSLYYLLIIRAWEVVDRMLTRNAICRQPVLRHFAGMAARRNKEMQHVPYVAQMYEDEIGDLQEHVHWMFDFSAACLDCPEEVRDWLRDKRVSWNIDD